MRNHFIRSLLLMFCMLTAHGIFAQTGSSLTFSEIMFNPAETNGEFVEIYNTSTTESVDLTGFKFKYYTSSSNGIVALTGGMILRPQKFAVILQGSYDYINGVYKNLIPADAIVLKISSNNFGTSGMANTTSRDVYFINANDVIIDSYTYSADNGTGISDEKFSLTKDNNAENWKNSLMANGTPGQANSIANTPRYSFGSLIINEIMYDPATGNSEYLEFYNTSNDSIQIGGMQIKLGTSLKVKLSNSFIKIAPKEYFVLASDTSIFPNYPWLKNETKVQIASSSFSLLNDGEMLVLKDMTGNTLDSLTYLPSWHNKNVVTTKNKSLERLNPLLNSNDKSNWSTSVSSYGATPGRTNSIFTENLSRESSVTVSPNPFSPDNDGLEDFTIINLDLNQVFSQVRIKVYDSQGRLVRVLENSRPSASKNSIIFDGMDDTGKSLRIGIYILLIETVSAADGSTQTLKAPVVVARKL